MNEGSRFTAASRCGHCGNVAPAQIVAERSALQEYSDARSSLSWEAGPIYQLARCPACSSVSLRTCYWHDLRDPTDAEWETLYPCQQDCPRGIPQAISKAYRAATRVRSIDPNAYGVLLGRVLELVCEDRAARGDSLAAKLRDLSSRAEIPAKLVDVANGLRRLRNVGAHASLGELTAAEVPVLEDLTRAILEYVYTAPLLAQDAEEALKRLMEETTAGRADSRGTDGQ